MESPPASPVAAKVGALAPDNVQQLQAILSVLSEGLAIAEPTGNIVHINAAAARILGYENPEEMSRDLASFGELFDVFRLDGTPVKSSERPLERALRGETLTSCELRFRRRDTGFQRIVNYNAKPVLNDDGSVMLGVVVLRDVTDEKQAEAERSMLLERERLAREQAEAAQRWYRNLADTIPQMVWTADPDGYTDYANRHWFDYTGLDHEHTYGFGWLTALHPDDEALALQLWRHCLQTGDVFETEYRFRRGGDGSYRWHLARALPVRDPGGNILKWFGTCTDIHEQKEIQGRLAKTLEDLRRTELRLRRIADSNLIGICFWKQDGTISEANDEYLRLLGFTRRELEAGLANWQSVTPPESRAADQAAWAELRAKGVAAPFEKEFLLAGGRRIPVLIGLAALDATVSEGCAFVVDLTKRKEAELALKQSNDDLQQFAFVVSHDLQQPLRMVTSYSQLLLRRCQGELDDDAREYIDFIIDGARRMAALIQDLLAFSRLGFGEMKPPGRIELSSIVEWALMNLQVAVQESGAKVIYGELPVVSVDQTQMVQVFQNLIGNALKYRSASPPEITIHADRKDGDWVIGVRDNGAGFDPVYAEQVFGVFKRLHGRDYPGTGIGLAICRRIVERHGGRIWATSSIGAGSTFLFTLPADD